MPAKKAAPRSKSPMKKPKGAGKAAASKAPAAAKAPAAPPEDPVKRGAAVRIQKHVRGLLARKLAKKMKEEKKAMKEEMDKLRQAAYLAEVQYERKQEEKRRKKDQEERAKKARYNQIRKDLLDACFDGEEGDVMRLLSEDVADVEMEDQHGNTLMSEAAAGGALGVIKILVERGANPNTQGEFKRTPLWRACFLGHPEVVVPLLEAGADPRIINEQGETPQNVASKDEIKSALEEWDISVTDKLVAKFEAMKMEREAAAKAEAAARVRGAEDKLDKAKQDYEKDQKALKKAHQELEKRIHEYDNCVMEHKPEDLIQVTLNMIKQAEVTLEEAKKAAAETSMKYQDAKYLLREQKEAEGDDEELVGTPVELKDLDDVLVKDVGNKLRDCGKWPLVIDVSQQASVFLRYLDTNYINALSSKNMEPNRLRRSVLGGIRYGKLCVLDFMDVDLVDEVIKTFDLVQQNLFQDILSKEILRNENYLKLIRKDDGEEYHPNKFQDARAQKFKMIFLTHTREPSASLVDKTYPLRVKVTK